MTKVGGPMLVFAALALAFAACGGGESALVATPSPAQTQTTTETIATPDLRSAVSPEEAEELLLQVPGVGDVLRAVAGGNADAFLRLIDWELWPCGSPRRIHQPLP